MECFSGTFPSLWPIAAYDLKVLCNFFIELILPNFKSKWYEHLDTSEYIKEWYKGSVSLRCYLCVKSTTLHYNGYIWTSLRKKRSQWLKWLQKLSQPVLFFFTLLFRLCSNNATNMKAKKVYVNITFEKDATAVKFLQTKQV